MSRWHLLFLFPVLAGCQRHVEKTVTVAAQPAALDCALRAADRNGYKPEQQPAHDGAPRLARVMFGRDGDPPVKGKDGHLTDYLTITRTDDSLRIVAVGASLEGKALAPSPRTLAHVQEIVSQCSASQ